MLGQLGSGIGAALSTLFTLGMDIAWGWHVFWPSATFLSLFWLFGIRIHHGSRWACILIALLNVGFFVLMIWLFLDVRTKRPDMGSAGNSRKVVHVIYICLAATTAFRYVEFLIAACSMDLESLQVGFAELEEVRSIHVCMAKLRQAQQAKLADYKTGGDTDLESKVE